MVHIIGGGLAGCEAAWQAARLGVPVTIYEMRPVVPTAVHKTDRLAELVCSNSFRGDKLDNAVGLLKEEMRRLGSIVMEVADRVRVPAGAALAVDREAFAEGMTAAIASHPLIRVERREIPRLPPSAEMSPVIVATGPLTSSALSADIAAFVGAEHLAFFDAISPIVLAETIDMTKVFRASRWNRSLGPEADAGAERRGRLPQLSVHEGRVRRVSRGHRLGREGRGARLRSHEVLRGMPADRSDGAPRGGHAALRSDEAGGAARSEDGPLAVRGGAVAPGQSRRRALQPGRLPDAAEVGRAGAGAADDSRPRAGRVRALRHDPPEHLHQRPDRPAADTGRRVSVPICSSPARCPGSRATWNPRRRASSRVRMPRGSRAGSRPSRCRGRRPSARWATTCRTRIRATTTRRTSRSASCRRSTRRRRPSRNETSR